MPDAGPVRGVELVVDISSDSSDYLRDFSSGDSKRQSTSDSSVDLDYFESLPESRIITIEEVRVVPRGRGRRVKTQVRGRGRGSTRSALSRSGRNNSSDRRRGRGYLATDSQVGEASSSRVTRRSRRLSRRELDMFSKPTRLRAV